MVREETIETIKHIIKELIGKMGIETDIEIREQSDTVVFNVRSSDSNMLIGQHGINLSALQYLCRVLTRRKLGETDNIDFIIDIDDYKKKREGHLSSLAEKVYKEVVNNKKTVVLRPMSSYERRVIHAALSNHQEITSDSIGEEPNRMVTIRPVGREINFNPQSIKFSEQEEYVVID